MQKLIYSLTCVTLLAFTANVGSAQEIITTGDLISGSRSLGMGGAQIGAANDPTAILSNPAALARINKLHFQLGLDFLNKKTEASLRSDTANLSGSGSEGFSGVGSFGLAYPIPVQRGSLVLGFGFNRVKDFSGLFKMSGFNQEAFSTDTEVWGGTETTEILEDGGINVVSLGGAFDISPNLAFGASLDFWNGSYTLDNRILRNDIPGQVSWLDIVGGEDDISAWSFKPSLLYFDTNFRLGAFVRFPMTFHITQDNYEEYYSANDGYFFNIHENIDPISGADYLDNPGETAYSSDYKIKAPMQIGFGLAVGTPQNGLAAFDMVYENWRDAKFRDEYDPTYFREKYRSTINWRVGFEKQLVEQATARLGYMRQPYNFKGPRSNTLGDPFIEVENEMDYLTLGLTVNLDRSFGIDFAYARGYGEIKEGLRKDKETRNMAFVTVNYALPVMPRFR